MPERETDLQREERERKNEGPIWAELELISRWLVVVAHDGEDLAKGMRERKKMPEREIDLAKGGKRERKNEGSIWWLLMMVTTGVVVVACGGAMKGQWEERALGKRKKMKKEKRQREEWVRVRLIFGERRYVMGQVFTGGSHSLLNFTKMPLKLNSQKLKTPNSCFHFPSPTSKIKPNKWSSVGPTWFGWWIMKTEWYHSVFMLSKHALSEHLDSANVGCLRIQHFAHGSRALFTGPTNLFFQPNFH